MVVAVQVSKAKVPGARAASDRFIPFVSPALSSEDTLQLVKKVSACIRLECHRWALQPAIRTCASEQEDHL